jgi:proton-translocating NADH-quinone oxidoreductase chain M
VCLLLVEIFLLLSFSAIDLIVFFFFFESVLLPMFCIIGLWGSRERRVQATLLFFMYTVFGSIFLLFSILLLYYDVGTTNFIVLSNITIKVNKQIVVWLFIYLAFSVKIPTIPLHLWLPEAHVEAPTAGSVILASLVLKLGGYGFVRVLLNILPQATYFYLPITDTFAIISIIYSSLTATRQIDMKRIIAYSSIAHMNLVVLGLFSSNIQGVMGGIFLMLAHGIVSAGLFFLIGGLYDKYGSRNIYNYGGLVKTMPMFSTQLVLFSFANIGLPGTCNFIGELTIFVGLIDRNFYVLLIAISGVVWSVLYTIIFCNRLVFGNLKVSYVAIFSDLNSVELVLIIPLFALVLLFGIFPDLIFDTIATSIFYKTQLS